MSKLTPNDGDGQSTDRHRLWSRRSVWVVVAVAVLLFAGVPVAWLATAATVSGTVTCSTGLAVSGVWAEGSTLGHVGKLEVNSGFADVRQTGPGTATFTWTRHLWGGQEFHVGCGNDGDQWRHVGYSEVTKSTKVVLTCYDAQSPAPNGDHFCKFEATG